MNGYIIIGLALVLLGFWFFRPPQAERKRKIVEEALQERLFYESQRYAQIRGNGLTRWPIEGGVLAQQRNESVYNGLLEGEG
jgi:hypothetical protein